MKITIDDILRSSKGSILSRGKEILIDDIVIDSREAKESSMFVAIVGESQDGHKYIDAAFKNGCRVFLVNEYENVKAIDNSTTIISVSNTEIALGEIAKEYKKKFDIPYIGITGSVGKTTTRDMVYSVVSEQFKALKNEKNFNNQFGVPLTLFKLDESYECGVIEMGMSGFKEIEYLANIVDPDIAVISNIGLSHVERLGSQEGIFEAKMEITTNFTESSILIINGDDKYLKTVKENDINHRVISVGFDSDCDIRCTYYNMLENQCIFECNIEGKIEEFKLPVAGRHNIYNAMSAIAVGISLGIPVSLIKEGLKKFKLTAMRLDIVKNKEKDIVIINDTYNASPDSMKASLDVLSLYDRRKVAILGDIYELGEYAEEGHRSVGAYTLGKADVLILVGDNAKYIADEAVLEGFKKSVVYYYEDKKNVNLQEILEDGDVVLVKASRGMELESIVELIKNNSL